MRDHRLMWVASTLAIVGLLSMPAPVAAADNYCLLPEDERPSDFREACATTLIRGDQAGHARIFIPEGTTFRLGGETGDYTITVPDDRFAGFVLQQERINPDVDFDFSMVTAWRYPSSMRQGEIGAQWGLRHRLLEGTDLLPTGWYRLYLLTEPGTEAEVELRFGGLEGQILLTPEDPSTIEVKHLTPVGPSPDPHTHYTAVASGEIVSGDYPPRGDVGLLIGGVAWKANHPTAARVGMCRHRELMHQAVAQIPVCVAVGAPLPNGSSSNVYITSGDGSYAREGLASVGTSAVGVHTFTSYVTSVGSTTSVASMGIWASLD